MRWQGESPSVEPKAGEQTLAAHKGAQEGATTRASMVITAQTCASKPFVRLGVAKLITYFTLRRHIARVNRPVKELSTTGNLLVAVSVRVFVHSDFTGERTVDVGGISRSEDHSHNPPDQPYLQAVVARFG